MNSNTDVLLVKNHHIVKKSEIITVDKLQVREL